MVIIPNESHSTWPEHEAQAAKEELDNRCGYGPAWEHDLSWLHWWEKTMQLDWQEIKNEKSRTYIFANGNQRLKIENVTRLCVRPSGNHRLETASGKKFIVRDWVAIEIETESWEH